MEDEDEDEDEDEEEPLLPPVLLASIIIVFATRLPQLRNVAIATDASDVESIVAAVESIDGASDI